jgi:hypothetical protein
VGAMSSMGEPGTYHKVLESLKRTLDPNGILAPGRYVPAEKPAALSAAATSSRA